jgi:rhodanese-related sulfurtransferase
MINRISRAEIVHKLDAREPIFLVEALPPRYFQEAHLPGAINIPHDQVRELAPRLLPDKAALVVTYCANGPCPNSGIAAGLLQELGYVNVREYYEGKEDWLEAGLPTVSETAHTGIGGVE